MRLFYSIHFVLEFEELQIHTFFPIDNAPPWSLVARNGPCLGMALIAGRRLARKMGRVFGFHCYSFPSGTRVIMFGDVHSSGPTRECVRSTTATISTIAKPFCYLKRVKSDAPSDSVVRHDSTACHDVVEPVRSRRLGVRPLLGW